MISVSGKKWTEQKVDTNLVEKIKQDHNFNEILTAYDIFFQNQNDQCNCIIANTTKGKGISNFENRAKWHYWNNLSNKEEQEIIRELDGISKR